MKLQQFAKLISKNVTILSIASAFALGIVGMTDIKDSLFDTSTWFMKPAQSEETEFENIAADPDKPDFDFGKNTSVAEPEITEEPSETSTEETTTEQTTTTEITTTESETSSEPTEDPSDVGNGGSDAVVPGDSSTETTEITKETEEPTKKTKKTKASEETTEEPSESTTEAPKETASEGGNGDNGGNESTTAPEETTTEATTTKKSGGSSLGDTSGSYNEDMAKEVLSLVNEQRAANGLAPLSWSGSLAKGAKTRATEIVVKWAHTRPDGSDFYDAPGCEASYGENLAKGYGSASSAMDGWMNSSGHRANILKPDYKTIGVACYVCNGQYYWVQEFGY